MGLEAFLDWENRQPARHEFYRFTPDVLVTCAARDLRTEMVFEQPTLVLEVLSESAQAFDRGARFAA